jgi:hypothetical protein
VLAIGVIVGSMLQGDPGPALGRSDWRAPGALSAVIELSQARRGRSVRSSLFSRFFPVSRLRPVHYLTGAAYLPRQKQPLARRCLHRVRRAFLFRLRIPDMHDTARSVVLVTYQALGKRKNLRYAGGFVGFRSILHKCGLTHWFLQYFHESFCRPTISRLCRHRMAAKRPANVGGGV